MAFGGDYFCRRRGSEPVAAAARAPLECGLRQQLKFWEQVFKQHLHSSARSS